jgi:hypothetical protein
MAKSPHITIYGQGCLTLWSRAGIDFGETCRRLGPDALGVKMIFQPTDTLHGALGEVSFVENRQSLASLFLKGFVTHG